MKFNLKSVLLALLAVLLVMQIFQIDKTNPPADPGNDFITLENPPQPVADVLRAACYDCHSHQTAYPWYTHVQPVAWWVQGHIKEGRKHLNFSYWGSYDPGRKNDKFEEIMEEVQEGNMPMSSYTWGHPEARLTVDQRDQLVNWARLKTGGGESGSEHGEMEEED